MLTTNKMTIEAVVCIIFLSFVRLTEGNNVTLLPDGTAYAVAGESLTLECIYSGQFNPFSFNFYLNPDNNGLQIRKSTCGILIATGYNTSLYSHSCNTSSVSLKILTISQSNFDQIWECDVSFITDPVPQKDSTVIKEAITTTVSSTPALSSVVCALEFFLGIALGVGLGNAAICIICLIVIVILVKDEKLAVDINIGETLRQHGSEVKIICSVYGSEDKSVNWTGQEENQFNGGRYTIASYDSSTNKSSLIIRTSTMTKAEGYICQVAFKESGVSLKIYITLSVNGSLRVSIEKIMLFVPASGKEGREWIGPQKNILPNTGRYTIVPYDSNTNESHITIKSFSVNDNGSYTCQPKNSSGSIQPKNSSGTIQPKNSSGTSPTYSIKISTNDAANPNKGARKLILGLGFGIICVACIVCIVILVMIGEPCALKFAIGLGLGLGIPFVGCIIVIVILVKKFWKPPPASKNGNVKSSSRSDVSRRDVEIQMEENSVKSNDERPLVIHNRIGNKDESETEHVLSKPFDPKERRPLPPLNKELEDKPNHRPQPIPSEKNDVKDQNLRGLSANFDDARGLASETPRPSKLPPIQHQVQSTVQEEDTSEEPKKNKKNRKKKDRTDEGKHADEIAK